VGTIDGMETGWAALGLALALIGVAMFIRAGRMWKQCGLPQGEVLYTDTGTWVEQKAPLYSARLQLTGRPDYLVEEPDGGIVPVEVKSGQAPPYPHQSHILQLAAYCLLVGETYGQRPARGILNYADRAFSIPFTPELEETVLDVLAEMHEDLYAGEVDRDHGDWQRCARCGHRAQCTQSLA
jgi:CRISPR-associated exonuclease Cas4